MIKVARLLAFFWYLFTLGLGLSWAQENLPVKVPNLPERDADIRNKLTFEQIHNIVGPDQEGKGLIIDLQDPNLYGTVYTGPYPFDRGSFYPSDYDYMRFRKASALSEGKGLLRISDYFRDKYNANDWPYGQYPFTTKSIAYRLDLFRINEGGLPEHLGFYDSVVAFREEGDFFVKNLTIVEGPFVAMVQSDDPTSMTVAFETDEPCRGVVYVALHQNWERILTFEETSYDLKHHEINVRGLSPDTFYDYACQCITENGESVVSEVYTFKTAPRAGQGVVRLVFVGDSREGVGGGERNYMGVNFRVLSQIALMAYREGADFFIFGGDLVNGYTSDPEDFSLQLKAFKQAVGGFWRSRPVYPGMGNHETLMNCYDDGSKYGICLDKWPYQENSAEAIFAREFFNPENGPEPSDPRRPSYKENVFKFKYGPLMVIAFNNNYWFTSNSQVATYGGSPEGYMLEDQVAWIEEALREAQADHTVKYVILYAQEPVWPCGGHVKDAMWWNGNNNIRAYVKNGDQVEPAGPGIIEIRNRLWKAIANCPKVAAVLGADEHEYYRVLIDQNTPVGIYPQDDTDGDGVLDQYSPNPEFRYPTWFITAGTGGAPYYNRQWTPWEPVAFSNQQGYLLIEAGPNKISAKFVSITGQVVDQIDDLMAVKR